MIAFNIIVKSLQIFILRFLASNWVFVLSFLLPRFKAQSPQFVNPRLLKEVLLILAMLLFYICDVRALSNLTSHNQNSTK